MITSPANPRVKRLHYLMSHPADRRLANTVFVEGADEINLAVGAGHHPEMLLVCGERTAPAAWGATEVIHLSSQAFGRLSARENADGFIALFPQPNTDLTSARCTSRSFYIAIESLEKPGNLGAILRTADAVAAAGVIVIDAHTDIFGPNTIRASRGTALTVPIYETSCEGATLFFRKNGIRTVAATPGASKRHSDVQYSFPLALLVGTEKKGLSDYWLHAADESVRIPMRGIVNSLNVSVATAVICYEILRCAEP